MKKKRISTRNLVLVYSVMILIVAVIFVAVAFYFSRTIRAARHAGDTYSAVSSSDVNFSKYYVMISSDRDLDFWKSVYKGAYEEGIKKGVCVEMMGENLSEDYCNTELMEIAIASRVDGIIQGKASQDSPNNTSHVLRYTL